MSEMTRNTDIVTMEYY